MFSGVDNFFKAAFYKKIIVYVSPVFFSNNDV